MSEILEAVMVICFGLSWPLSVYKSYTSRTAKGKSPFFLVFIFIGYLFGIARKILDVQYTYVLFLYMLNAVMVFTDLMLYLRNKKLDAESSEGRA